VSLWGALIVPPELDEPTDRLLATLCGALGAYCDVRQPGVVVLPQLLDGSTLEPLCEALTVINERYLRQVPRTPNLYESGVRYTLLPEYWMSIPWALWYASLGYGVDCKVLAAWRAAELRVRYGERGARCVWSKYEMPGKVVYHVRVRRADGRIEDPSVLLGMTSVSGSTSSRRSLKQGHY
jgi:hypothetical protein